MDQQTRLFRWTLMYVLAHYQNFIKIVGGRNSSLKMSLCKIICLTDLNYRAV